MNLFCGACCDLVLKLGNVCLFKFQNSNLDFMSNGQVLGEYQVCMYLYELQGRRNLPKAG